jgi:retron-type reverse transcriptase
MAAEEMEGRGLAKGNPSQQNAFRTQGRIDALSALERVRHIAEQRKQEKFTALLHHIYNLDTLRTAYRQIKRQAAPGVDGETWQHYGEALEENLQGLAHRLRRGAYRAKPVRRAYIPKADGRMRPLGVTALEDKIVQRATVEVLNAIYETDFLGFSYGFRPGRNQHQALDALFLGLYEKRVNFVLDLDVRSFFDRLSHDWLLPFLQHRIADRRVLRLIQKWLSAGVLEEGKRIVVKEGSPQGGSITPLTQKVIFSSNGQLRDGEPGTPCLICASRGNTFMAHDTLDQSGEGSALECCSWPTPTSYCTSRGSAALSKCARLVRAASISLPGGSLPVRSANRGSRDHCASHVEASAGHGGTAPQVREQGRPDDGRDRDHRVECVSAHAKKAWLSRVAKADHFKSTFPIRLIACTSPSSRRLTTFWCRVASAPSACA